MHIEGRRRDQQDRRYNITLTKPMHQIQYTNWNCLMNTRSKMFPAKTRWANIGEKTTSRSFKKNYELTT